MKNIKIFSLFICLSATFLSCKKEDTTLGKDGLESDAFLASQAIDTFSLETSMYVEDSLISDNLSTALLGSYNDPITGSFESEIYTQFQLAGLSPDFSGSAIKIDSFVLGLEYKGYYGNLDPQTFEVYEISDDIYLDSTYYSFQSKATKGGNLVQAGKGLITPDPAKATIIDGTTVDPQLRLHLDTAFARAMIEETTLNPSKFESNENFLAYFKGLNIKVNNVNQVSGKGGIFYFNLNDPLSKLTLYYTQDGVQKEFDLLINDECADFNHITINNSTSVQNVIDNSAFGQNEFYVQANKSRAHVVFTTIDKIPKNAIIQYAKLDLPVSFYNYDVFHPSATISVATKISATDDDLYDLGVTSDYDNFNKNFVIDVRDYIQRIVNGDIENRGIYLSPSRMITSAERIVFNGSNSSNKKQPKLKIVYTTY